MIDGKPWRSPKSQAALNKFCQDIRAANKWGFNEEKS
jgi:hypothetical protein